jgi:hypothetical protein
LHVKEGFDAAQRRLLADALERADPLACPACGATLARTAITPEPGLAYVRRRVWLICPACKRSATLDERRTPRRG